MVVRMNRQKITRAIDRLGTCIHWPKDSTRRTVFLSTRPHPGGPGTFVAKITGEWVQQGLSITYRRLRTAQGALIVSTSWGDWFHALCRKWEVRTVLRLDGFYVPTYFDNRPQPPEHQDRRLTLDRIRMNYRIQRDLVRSDFVIYQSKFSKKMADRYLYYRRDDFAIIHNGVDLVSFCPEHKRRGRRRLLSAGMLRHEYMLGTVLPVFERLWQQHNLEMIVVGHMDDISRQLLKGFAKRAPRAAERVTVVGPVSNEEMAHHMRQADILVHPRQGDWCPNVVIEAMACGLPVVCASWGGAAELVGDGGIVVPTGQWTYDDDFVHGMASGTEKVLENLEYSQQAARAHAEAQFDIRQVAQKYLAALELAEG